ASLWTALVDLYDERTRATDAVCPSKDARPDAGRHGPTLADALPGRGLRSRSNRCGAPHWHRGASGRRRRRRFGILARTQAPRNSSISLRWHGVGAPIVIDFAAMIHTRRTLKPEAESDLAINIPPEALLFPGNPR